MQEVQDACVQGNASLKVHCQNAPVKKTHVTVLVAHVTEPQLETAKALVDNVLQNKILPHLPHKEFKISFKGMSSYTEKIVYARPQRSIETIALFDQWSGTIENH